MVRGFHDAACRRSIRTDRDHPRRAQALAAEAGAPRRGDRRGMRGGGARGFRAHPAVDAIHPGVDSAVPDPHGDGRRGPGLPVHRQAAAAERVRPAGRPVPRGARAVARSGDHQCGGGGRIQAPDAVARAGAEAGAQRRPEGPRARGRPARGEESRTPVFGRARRRARARGGDFPAGSRLHAARVVRAPSDFAQRRSGGAVQHRGHAGPHDDSPRRRPACHREAAWLPGGPGGPDDPEEPLRRVRARPARPDRRQVRRHALRRRGADRVFRRGGRCAFAGVHAEGRRHAVRQEARAGISLPGVYRDAAAQDRGRRRHRRAPRHRDSGPRRADDGRGRRCDRRRRQGPGTDGRAAGRRAESDLRRRSRRLLSHRAGGLRRTARRRLAEVLHRRARRSAAHGIVHETWT